MSMTAMKMRSLPWKFISYRRKLLGNFRKALFVAVFVIEVVELLGDPSREVHILAMFVDKLLHNSQGGLFKMQAKLLTRRTLMYAISSKNEYYKLANL